jgi:hypothetical protein
MILYILNEAYFKTHDKFIEFMQIDSCVLIKHLFLSIHKLCIKTSSYNQLCYTEDNSILYSTNDRQAIYKVINMYTMLYEILEK